MNRKVTMRETIREELRRQLEIINVDDPIETEFQLAYRYGVSRTTIRLAIDDLVREGRLYRIKGSGTYKARGDAPIENSKLIGFTHSLKTLFGKVELREMTLETDWLPSELAHRMGKQAWTGCWKFTRVWQVNDRPFAYGIALINREILPNFSLEGMRDSLTETMTEVYGQKIKTIENRISSRLSDGVIGAKLGVPVNSAVLRAESCNEIESGEKLFIDIRYTEGNAYSIYIKQTL